MSYVDRKLLEIGVTMCPACFVVGESWRDVCSYCGHVFTPDEISSSAGDCELLELAAKAAGYDVIKEFPYQIAVSCGAPNPLDGVELFGLVIHDGVKVRSPWNPLTDDGDALSLAVKLDIDLQFNTDDDEQTTSAIAPAQDAPPNSGQGWSFTEGWRGDKRAATRRAIVRAAAAIGRAMS